MVDYLNSIGCEFGCKQRGCCAGLHVSPSRNNPLNLGVNMGMMQIEDTLHAYIRREKKSLSKQFPEEKITYSKIIKTWRDLAKAKGGGAVKYGFAGLSK